MSDCINSSPDLGEMTIEPASFPRLIVAQASASASAPPDGVPRPSNRDPDETVEHAIEGSVSDTTHRPLSRGRKVQEDGRDELIGASLAHYRIQSLLGRGSMGRVYRAHHVGLDRVCALKVMDPPPVSDRQAQPEQFWAEARAAANLIHPHV